MISLVEHYSTHPSDLRICEEGCSCPSCRWYDRLWELIVEQTAERDSLAAKLRAVREALAKWVRYDYDTAPLVCMEISAIIADSPKEVDRG